MEVDSKYLFQATPFNVYPESVSFFMEFAFSKDKKSGKSFIFGKVTDILETKTLCSIYNYRHHRQKRTNEIVRNPAKFSDLYALELLEKSLSVDWTKSQGFQQLCHRCKALNSDDFKELMKLHLDRMTERRHSTPCALADLNVCSVFPGQVAWSCTGSVLVSLEVLTYFCAQNGRALKILIPSLFSNYRSVLALLSSSISK